MQKTVKDMAAVFVGLSEDGKYIIYSLNPEIKLPEGVSELAVISADIESSEMADSRDLLTIENKGEIRYALPADLNPNCRKMAAFLKRALPLVMQKDQAKTPEGHKKIDREFNNIVKEIREQEG
jgi:hypothetical protein